MSPGSTNFTYLNFNLSQSVEVFAITIDRWICFKYLCFLFVSRHLCKYMHIFMYIYPQMFEENIRNLRTGVTGCEYLDNLCAWKRDPVFYKRIKHLKPLAISPGPQLGLLIHCVFYCVCLGWDLK